MICNVLKGLWQQPGTSSNPNGSSCAGSPVCVRVKPLQCGVSQTSTKGEQGLSHCHLLKPVTSVKTWHLKWIYSIHSFLQNKPWHLLGAHYPGSFLMLERNQAERPWQLQRLHFHIPCRAHLY